MFKMPGRSHKGVLPPLTAYENDLAGQLALHVEMLAETIGERNIVRYSALQKAAAYITDMFVKLGYTPREESYIAEGRQVENIEAQLQGTSEPEEIVIIGAHYDSVSGSPGADDNASGVAALLELARFFSDAEPPGRTLRFVAFVNEEPPFFYWSKLMGSRVYAAGARKRRERIAAMISLETIGYYADTAGSQSYPPPLGLFYPHAGNFIAFVSNLGSRSLLHRCIGTFRETTRFPSEGLAAPAIIPGVGWSDQCSFWREGYPAIMLTDTALYRYPHYHRPTDMPDNLDYNRMARVVAGMRQVVEGLLK
ncbi:MAG: M20/M25/M40 family metallo-hydrolase [Deltaproteobacteria bacterium]|nr:M20/M25/M40 family metallo-hydrolase [Deltaproteobacteria bacterium]